MVGVSVSPWQSGYADATGRGEESSDVHLYHAEVARIQRGEGYYEAAAVELPARGYPTQSVFNWRTPLPMWLVGKLPRADFGRALIAGLALLAVIWSITAVELRGGLRQAICCALLLIGALLPCVLETAYVMPVVWAATLMAGSIAAFGTKRTRIGVALGVAAMFVRDLAVGYVVVSLGLAVVRRRWSEVGAWLAGLVAWGCFFAWHAEQVAAHRPADAVAHVGSWLQSGGLAFVLSASQMNSYLLLLPQWVTAIYLALALLGFAGWRDAWGERVGAITIGYLLVFAFVGYDFNQYWGMLTAPLLCIGAARGPSVLVALWNAAWPVRKSRTVITS